MNKSKSMLDIAFVLFKEGLTTQQFLVISYLITRDGLDYLSDIVESTGVSLSSVRRCCTNRPDLFSFVELESQFVLGGSRPRNTGVELTKKGKKMLTRSKIV